MEDKIEEIPKTMEKFFGCSGKMVKPTTETVKAIVYKIHKGELISTDLIREKIAQDFNVQATCPMSVNKALKAISKEENPANYWRVIKKNGELINQFPEGINGHAAKLENEGFEIDHSKKNPVVKGYKAKLKIP